jgi:hypothetical protein
MIKNNAIYSVTEELLIEYCIHSGVIDDTIIEVSFKDENKNVQKVKLRKVRFYDRKLKKEFEFLTNLFEMRAYLIVAI